MTKFFSGVAGVLLALILIAPVYAVSSKDTGTWEQQRTTHGKKKSTKNIKKRSGKLDRSKAKQEVNKQKELRQQMIESGGSAN
jgi:hypothetical protein